EHYVNISSPITRPRGFLLEVPYPLLSPNFWVCGVNAILNDLAGAPISMSVFDDFVLCIVFTSS
ncbi:MAG: hypothetical protein ACYTXE_46145, partial [Nostoc sp.]